MTDHIDLDTDAIAARINREHTHDGGLSHDVNLLTSELRYVQEQFVGLQQNISDIIHDLEGAVERLSRLQRGSHPESDSRLPH